MIRMYIFSLLLIGVLSNSCTDSSNNISLKGVLNISFWKDQPSAVNNVKGTTKALVAETDTTLTTQYITGKFNPITHDLFIQVDPVYANGRKDRYLRKETYKAFLAMYRAAKADGIELKILSATRNFDSQKNIWEGKWMGKRLHEGKENLAQTTPNPEERALKILLWSSMPGTSRHHWGTDIDLNALNNEFFEEGEGLKIYTWLNSNAFKFGFWQPYTPKEAGGRTQGYNEEKWHWSFLPIALKLTRKAKLELSDEMISGFKGSETASEIGVVENYILGINKDCL